MRGAIGNLDVAQITLYFFWLFFAGLVFYLRKEDRREGYPLEGDSQWGAKNRDFIWIPAPKTFLRWDGQKVTAPNYKEDRRPINGTKTEPWGGAPLTPTGDPLLANVGPGSYAQRSDIPYKTAEGHDLLAPLRVATNFAVPAGAANPTGYAVVGADRIQGGVIRDLWVDRAESILRYYEADLPTGRRVMIPIHFASIDSKRRTVTVNALNAAQFANVPAIKDADRITLLEEDKISAYYGAGTLYATVDRVEPLL